MSECPVPLCESTALLKLPLTSLSVIPILLLIRTWTLLLLLWNRLTGMTFLDPRFVPTTMMLPPMLMMMLMMTELGCSPARGRRSCLNSLVNDLDTTALGRVVVYLCGF